MTRFEIHPHAQAALQAAFDAGFIDLFDVFELGGMCRDSAALVEQLVSTIAWARRNDMDARNVAGRTAIIAASDLFAGAERRRAELAAGDAYRAAEGK